MERAQNSDSETPVEKLNPTSTTDFSYKTLCIVFFGAPCTFLSFNFKIQWQGQFKESKTLSFPFHGQTIQTQANDKQPYIGVTAFRNAFLQLKF